MLARRVDMLGGAAPLMGGDHLDQAEPLKRAHVVGDGAERRVEMLGELNRARVALLEHREDAHAQRVRERFHIARILNIGDRLMV